MSGPNTCGEASANPQNKPTASRATPTASSRSPTPDKRFARLLNAPAKSAVNACGEASVSPRYSSTASRAASNATFRSPTSDRRMDRLLAQCACCSGLRSAEVARRLVAAKAAPANAGCPTGISLSILPRGRSAPDSISAVRACAKGPPWVSATSSASFHRNGLSRRARRARQSAASLSREEARVRVTQALRACWPHSSLRVTIESSASGASMPGTFAGS